MKVFEIAPVKYIDNKMLVLDQTRLPGEEVYEEMHTKEDVWEAIYKLKVRGAPAIGRCGRLWVVLVGERLSGYRYRRLCGSTKRCQGLSGDCQTYGGESGMGAYPHVGQVRSLRASRRGGS